MHLLRLISLLLALGLLAAPASCKNYFGNPYKNAGSPRVTPVAHANLRVEPANWWVGLKHNKVEILFHQPGIGVFAVKLGKGVRGIKLLSVAKADSPNYLFVTLEISPRAKAQKVPLVFTQGSNLFTHEYPILSRNEGPKAQGVNSSDVVYLIFPDRFSNGNPDNDQVKGMLEGLSRDSLTGRHGGDIQGIRNHMDYLLDLGVSTIWLNPELENDQPSASYHGYAVTDHYRVDRRFGTNDEYRDWVGECHRKGLKVVRDVVFNHIGSNHYWMKDLPFRDWINQWPAYTQTSYRAPTLLDPYASAADLKLFADGWFDRAMPDLNQRNPHLAQYLIQQAIWWVEFAGLDDFRIDTYTYSDQAFMSRWCREMREEYPRLNMFGEIWEHGVPVQGFFADDQPMTRAGFDSNLPGVIDFQVMFAFHEALTRSQGWTEGIAKVYYVLAQDYFYKDPMKNLIMLDNHDFTRFYSVVGENFNKYKSGMAFLLTMRGIPQIYYATEILGTGYASPSHGNIRKDFPGGWPNDPANKFTTAGRTALENEAHRVAKTLIQYRKNCTALQTGRMMQFVPIDGVYTYFRYDDKSTVMVVLNTADEDRTINFERFAERTKGFTGARNVLSGEKMNSLGTVKIERNSPLVLELMR